MPSRWWQRGEGRRAWIDDDISKSWKREQRGEEREGSRQLIHESIKECAYIDGLVSGRVNSFDEIVLAPNTCLWVCHMYFRKQWIP
mmetsp:Transcript_26209/g.51465  ORF Transcript_26209/g.51465 Transcript_26209/m.51465 type:complete len:86 (+) Transcript_26209:407-664(+)